MIAITPRFESHHTVAGSVNAVEARGVEMHLLSIEKVRWLLLGFRFFFFQAEDGIRDLTVTGVQTCALPIYYLQLIEGAANEESRVLEVARISRALKAIARELEIPVVALSQLSRQIEQRGKIGRASCRERV